MSTQDFGVVAIVIPDGVSDRSNGARLVNDAYGFSLRASGIVRTLSSNNPSGFDIIQGLLYYPELDRDDPCYNETRPLVPSNVTTRAQIPLGNYPLISVAPWTSVDCVQSYLEVMRFDNVRAGMFFQNDNSSDRPPAVNDHVWSLNDGGQWQNDNRFPVYALPGMFGSFILEQLAQYSGNMSQVPYGDELVQIYNPNDTVRLYTRMDVSSSNGIPPLWIFLIIVLAILLAVVLITSIIMHMVQRRQRHALQRRVANGEVDLEALGIKRLNVPQDILDKMPIYTYTSKTGAPLTQDTATDRTAEPETNSTDSTVVPPTTPNGSLTREVPFSQPTCPICLDDFVHNESTVRELPCNHIFHPECIDSFLRDNSSLCPMCKKSSLPAGYCPVVVTNLMVRRERLVRRMRQRRIAQAGQAAAAANAPGPTMPTPIAAMNRSVRRISTPFRSRPHPDSSAAGAHGAAAELQPIADRRHTLNDDMPPEIRAQGTSARRAWRRERLARQEASNYNEQAEEARAADVARPLL
ncbi:hypothetical protein B0A52_00927 [Exophiala mesophila]|uniref:RING-type domain-containing protein n=1 Tax=Exophiala mesophila TaxID=212818 RepID=A0A438NIL4_EXOME|nr:hypothetical protein B0A52_00927 [Exophiala mesophila]